MFRQYFMTLIFSYYMLMRLTHYISTSCIFIAYRCWIIILLRIWSFLCYLLSVDILASWHLDWWMRYVVCSSMLLSLMLPYHMRNMDVMLTCRDAHIWKIVEVEVYLHEVKPHRRCLIDCLMLKFLASSWGHDERKQPVICSTWRATWLFISASFQFSYFTGHQKFKISSKFMSSC